VPVARRGHAAGTMQSFPVRVARCAVLKRAGEYTGEQRGGGPRLKRLVFGAVVLVVLSAAEHY
jgi:hypothetical protein